MARAPSVASRACGAAMPFSAAMAEASTANSSSQASKPAVRTCANGMAQASGECSSRPDTTALTCAPLRTDWRMRCANRGWSLRRLEPITSTRCRSDSEAMEVPSQRTPGAAPNSARRSRWSMFSLPRPRTRAPARASSSSVLCGLTSAPMDEAPCSAWICLKPLATYSSAVCQSTACHWPPCLIIGCVRRSSPFSASYEKRSRSAIQHSLTSSFSSGTTRITWLLLTWTIRLAPVESCGLTDLRRDSSQVRAL